MPNRRLLDWPMDVLTLANHLGLDTFSILAYSLGGPYGFACAVAIPQPLYKVGIVSGAAMFTEPELMKNINEGTRNFLTMPREKPFLSRLFLGLMLGIMPRLAPAQFIKGAASVLPESDREVVISSREFQDGFIHMVREATNQGIRGALHESLLSVTDYGFRLQDGYKAAYINVLYADGTARDTSMPVNYSATRANISTVFNLLASKMTGLDKQGLLGLTKSIITTLGERGSQISTEGSAMAVPAAKVTDVLDPTGAGDAFRAGLLKGLAMGRDMETAAKIGAVAAVYAVEKYGTQEHRYSFDEFVAATVPTLENGDSESRGRFVTN